MRYITYIFTYIFAFVVFGTLPAAAAEHVVKANSAHEECIDMSAGQSLSFRFKVNGKVGFNLHYHEGETKDGETFYLIEEDGIKTMEETAVQITADEKYCLMWINNHWADKKLDYEFEIVPAINEAE